MTINIRFFMYTYNRTQKTSEFYKELVLSANTSYVDGQGSKHWDTKIIKPLCKKVGKSGMFHCGVQICRGNSLY